MSAPTQLRRIAALVEHPGLFLARVRGLNMRFVQDLTRLKHLFQFNPRSIIDIGAAAGEFTMACRFVFPSARVCMFEPVTDWGDRLKALQENDPKIVLYQYALGDTNKESEFHLNDFVYSSSLLRMTPHHRQVYPKTSNEKSISVHVRTLDSFTFDLERPVLMKIDVQGSELDVLHGAAESLKSVDAVRLEVSFDEFYEGQATYDQISVLMKRSGFPWFFQVEPEIVEGETPHISFCDLIFMR